MKLGIVTLALAALALTAFVSSDADANGQHMVMHVSGGNFITSTVDGQPTPLDGQPFTALQSGIARGPGGVADFLSQAVIDAIPQDPSMFPPACLAQGRAGSTLSTTLVVSYKDGSLLSMTTDDGSYFCTDGTAFTVDRGRRRSACQCGDQRALRMASSKATPEGPISLATWSATFFVASLKGASSSGVGS